VRHDCAVTQTIIGSLIVGAWIALGIWGRRTLRTNPFHAAFSATAAAALFLVSGLVGYSLRHGLFNGMWTGGVVWWEIRLGILFSILAAYFWRKSLRSLA
jgi:hypothetical protein